jgi:Domain of unknown function (DUF4837)
MKNFLLMFFAFTTIFSCKKNENASTEISGKPNAVSIIIDDELWNGEIGDSLRNKFASPVIGLPQEEPLFTLNQYPVKLLEGFMSNSRNIIIIKKEAKSRFEIIENKLPKPQNVVYISGKTVLEIQDSIQNNAIKIINKIKETEINDFQKLTRKSLLDSKKINKKFNIDINIPLNYNYVMRRSKFIWLKKEISSGSVSLIGYQIPINQIKNEKKQLSQILKTRDSIGHLFIHGSVKNTKMLTDVSVSPFFEKTIINGRPAFETRGLWQMNNDFMSGPFINYTILDKPHNRILVLEGFCYAPSKEKRDLMFELESIIKSINILK